MGMVRKTGGNFEVTGTQADFERDADIDLNEQYDDEMGSDEEGESDGDQGILYQPTLIAKTKTQSKKNKAKQKSS